MDVTNLVFDGKHGRLVFHGNCTEMRSVCEAMCCRKDWKIGISTEEHASGIYDSEIICTLTDKACRDTLNLCTNRRYRLAKREDRSCVHLKENLCSIYAKRPKVCRDFVCSGGWRLDSVFPNEEAVLDKKPDSFREIFISCLNDDLIFVMHPLIKVHTVFYRKTQRNVIFVKEMIGGKCGKFNTQDSFDYPQLDDAKIIKLMDLFNRKEPLKSIFQTYCSEYPELVTQNEFFEIIWLLNKHNIVLDSSNFAGMLNGIGGLD